MQRREATYIETRGLSLKSSCSPTKTGKTCRSMAYCNKDKQKKIETNKALARMAAIVRDGSIRVL